MSDQEQPRYSIGWDVGAWNCDEGDSRDALVILADGREGQPTAAGRPWRGNLRPILDEKSGGKLLLEMMRVCGVEPASAFRATIAIDTPLGWPSAMIELVVHGRPGSVPKKADLNPYLFRRTELSLFGRDHRPLSAVRDMIGSQSTKGIHFLKKAGLLRKAAGVWEASYAQGSVAAVEAYPAPCLKSATVRELFSTLVGSAAISNVCARGKHVRADVEDAVRCAAVAWLFANEPGKLLGPDGAVPEEEGWIWLPEDCLGDQQG